MDISFLHPAFLWLLLAVPVLWFYPRGGLDRTQAVLRSLLFVLTILALARPVLLAASGAMFQVLVLDRSDSLSPAQHEQAAALAGHWLKQAPEKDKSTVIVIDGTSPDKQQNSAEQTDSALFAAAGTVVRISSSGSTSSLSAALEAARRQIPQGSPGVITLVSDGLSTDRRWGPVVQDLIASGIAVNTADLGRDDSDLYPAGIKTDRVLHAGQTAHLDVQVIGKAAGVRVRLSDAQGEQLAVSEPVDINGRTTVPVEFEPPNEGFMTVRAEVLPGGNADSDTTDNAIDRTLAIQAPIRLLYLGERMQGGAVRLARLLGRGFQIKDGSDWDLNSSPDLKNYDLVMVDDRTVSRMPEQFQEELSTAVREQGLGLIFSGGKASFGTGGYDQSTLAQVLPVEFPQHTEKRDPSTALALIIDTSGSMDGTRIELAKQIARLAVRRLKAHDRIGIVEFYGNKHWALPMQSAANKISVDRAIGRMQAIGGTVLYPAIEEAFYGLKNVATRYKHILVVTDGGVEDADYESLVRRIAKDHINVSTVLVGAQAHSASLIDLASWGRGRFYSASDRYALPELILKQPSTMKLPAYKTGAFPVDARGGEGWWDRIDRQALPGLSGYVETRTRPGGEVLIEVRGNGDPVLASWHYGLGRVTAFMTEPVGDGTEGWRQWRDYGRLLARVASRTADDSQPFSYEITRDDERVTVTARRYSKSATLYPQARLLDAKGQEGETLAFRQLAPDYFSAEWPADPAGEIKVSAAARDASGQVRSGTNMRLVSMAAADTAPEKQVDPAAGLDLAALAHATAGAQIDPAHLSEAAFKPQSVAERNSLALHKLWPFALLLALLLYLAELIYRRWPRT